MRPSPASSLLALLLDSALVIVAMLLALYTWFGGLVPEAEAEQFRRMLPLIILSEVGALHVAGAYGKSWLRASGSDYWDLVQGIATGTVLLVVFSFYWRILEFSRAVFAINAAFALVLVSLWRFLAGVSAEILWKRGLGLKKAVLIGEGNLAGAIERRLSGGSLGMRLTRVIPPDEAAASKALDGGEEIVILALPGRPRDAGRIAGDIIGRPGVELLLAPGWIELLATGAEQTELGGIPVLDLTSRRAGKYYLPLKRMIDITISLLLLPPAAIVIGILAVLIKATSPGPVFFGQRRVGRDGRTFTIWKLRTMRADGEGPALTEENDPRITRLGKTLRRWSFDELPQLWNILKGEMSIVGPRPEIPEIVEEYAPWQSRALEAPPGLTGLAQVTGRDDLSIEEKSRIDLFYLQNRSLILDIKIILRTMIAIVKYKGRA